MKNPYSKRIELSNNVYVEAYSTSISLWCGDIKQEVFIKLKDVDYFIQELKQLVVEVKSFEAEKFDKSEELENKELINELMLDKLSEL